MAPPPVPETTHSLSVTRRISPDCAVKLCDQMFRQMKVVRRRCSRIIQVHRVARPKSRRKLPVATTVKRSGSRGRLGHNIGLVDRGETHAPAGVAKFSAAGRQSRVHVSIQHDLSACHTSARAHPQHAYDESLHALPFYASSGYSKDIGNKGSEHLRTEPAPRPCRRQSPCALDPESLHEGCRRSNVSLKTSRLPTSGRLPPTLAKENGHATSPRLQSQLVSLERSLGHCGRRSSGRLRTPGAACGPCS